MKRSFRLITISFLFLIASSFISVRSEDNNFCEDVKKITTAFNNKEFDKLKGKAIIDETAPNDKQYVSSINLKGYISQIVYESEKDIYFAAVLNEDFKDADAFKEGLGNLTGKLETCLGLKPEYSETKSFLTYRFVFDSGVEVKLSGNYPNEKRRYINLEVTYKK